MENKQGFESIKEPSDTSQPGEQETVWSYRGYQIRPAEFNTAMVHFYRGEISRSNTWRNRLDATTNWAVVTAAASITFALSEASHNHAVIILNMLLTTLFLWIEARRYRYYELWSYRVRLMETDFFGSMLVPPFQPSADWAESLAESLLNPDFPISMWEAVGRRFRRNYLWIYTFLIAAWLLKLFLHPIPAVNLGDVVERASVGLISGQVVILVGTIFIGGLFLMGFLTAGLHQATGEVLPQFETDVPILSKLWHSMEVRDTTTTEVRSGSKDRVRRAPIRKRKQLLAMIISEKPQALADRLLKDMQRGVTALHGRGMYTGQEREVLLTAVTVTEMPQLKALVQQEDPQAFMIVSPAQDVIGRGFQTLEA